MATNAAALVRFEDRETELIVLVTSIMRREALVDLLSLDVDDFYSREGREIFSAIIELNAAGEGLGFLPVRHRLMSRGSYDAIGGDNFYLDFTSIDTTLHYTSAMRTLRRMANRRRLYHAMKSASKDLIETDDIDQVVNYLNGAISGIADIGESYADFATIAADGVAAFVDPSDRLMTGLDDIDRRLGGLFPMELVVVAARPGIGKTTLAEQIAEHVAREHDVLFVSLEMPNRHLGLKMVSRASRIDSQRIRQGTITEQERDRISAVLPKLCTLRMAFVEDAMTIQQVESRIVRYLERKQARLVVLDYIQLVTVPGKNKPRYEQVGDVSRMLKRIAKMYRCTIIALAQLSRSAENIIPELKDLRESGDIEQDADTIIFLHDPNKRDSKYADGGLVNLFITKNRNGRVGACDLYFNKTLSEFAPVAEDGLSDATIDSMSWVHN